jgi:hypothetical protein
MSTENGGRISVSEDKLRLLFAEFKLELVKELSAYATIVALEQFKQEISGRLRAVEDYQIGSAAVSRVQKLWLGFAAAFVTTVASGLIYLAASGGFH